MYKLHQDCGRLSMTSSRLESEHKKDKKQPQPLSLFVLITPPNIYFDIAHTASIRLRLAGASMRDDVLLVEENDMPEALMLFTADSPADVKQFWEDGINTRFFNTPSSTVPCGPH